MYTIPEALGKLFGHGIARKSPYLRNIANSFVRNRLVLASKDLVGERRERKATLIDESQMPPLHNAILLHAFQPNTAKIKRAFTNKSTRLEIANIVEAILITRSSLMGIGLQSSNVRNLIESLRSDIDLRSSKLPNPFTVLPHQIHGDINLLCGVLAQASSLSSADSLLLAYLRNDLSKAYASAIALENVTDELEIIKNRVIRDYLQANEFDAVIDAHRDTKPPV
jgi:hypothetical protein